MSLLAFRPGCQTSGWEKDFEPSRFSADLMGADETPSITKASSSSKGAPHFAGRFVSQQGSLGVEFASVDPVVPPVATESDMHRNQLAAGVRAALQVRLLQLRTDFLDDFGRNISADSIEALWALMDSDPNLIRPSLTAEPSGSLIASWRKSPVESLSVRFVNANTLHYSLVVPATAGDGNPERRWGEADVASFLRAEPIARRLAT